MSHPVPGHDYSEKFSDESHKEYLARMKKGMAVKMKSYKGQKGKISLYTKGKDQGESMNLGRKGNEQPRS